MEYLKISVITVSYNQGKFIEDNILSVLNQKYPNFEHIVIDACSTDNTLNILKKYSHLKWISEPDNGQSEGLNKGFHKATGDLIVWLNSDDVMCAGAFEALNKWFVENPDKSVVTGNQVIINERGKIDHIIKASSFNTNTLLNTRYCCVMQNATVWRRVIFEKCGYLDETFHYNMDYEFFVRISKHFQSYIIDTNIAMFRVWEDSKTSTSNINFLKEKWRAKRIHHAKWLSSGTLWHITQFVKYPIKRLLRK